MRRRITDYSSPVSRRTEIRTPDPQIRSLVAPAVIAIRLIVPDIGPVAASIIEEIFEGIVETHVL
jgi:hypothetical protein